MPLYAYECKECQSYKEEVHSVDDRHNAGHCACSGVYRIVITQVNTVDTEHSFVPHYDYQLGKHFDTASEKKAYLEKTNQKQTSGDLSPRSGCEGMRVACTKDQAKKLDTGTVNPFSERKKIQVTV